jgi:hypothetical protein
LTRRYGSIDDDLEIMLSRYPADETPSITLHLTPPKSTSNISTNNNAQTQGGSNSTFPNNYNSKSLYSTPPREKKEKVNGILNKSSGSVLGSQKKKQSSEAVTGGGHIRTITPEKPVHENHNHFSAHKTTSNSTNTPNKAHTNGNTHNNQDGPTHLPNIPKAPSFNPNPPSDLVLPPAPKSTGARSTRSTATALTTRPKSVHPNTGAIRGYEDDDDVVEGETLGDKHKRKWKAFHEGRGVRTVVGSIGGVKDGEFDLGFLVRFRTRPYQTVWFEAE